MKITEIVNGIHSYVATVRIKRGKTATTAKTIIYAENATQARNLLSLIYGDDSVVSVSKVSESDLNEAVPNGTIPRSIQSQSSKPVPRILPKAYTHKLAQNALLNQMKRNALQVRPTIDDLRAAQDEFEGEQRRLDREYEDAVNDRAKWAEIRKRRLV
jgi:nicotinic acid mononucleotide adenylyltransferase